MIVCAVAVLTSCQCNRPQSTGGFDDSFDTLAVSESMEEDLNKSKTILYTLPSPIEMASLIKESDVKYNEDMLNDIGLADKYSGTLKMAINLGMYSTDMSFASMFNQSQKTVEYFSALKDLSGKLGIVNLIDENTIARMEEKSTSKEDILKVISDVYMDVNQYLTENNRKNVAVMVLTGGWTEGLYIALSLVGDKPNTQLNERIVAQKLALATVVNILEKTNPNGTDEDITYLQNKMNEIKVVFDEVRVELLGEVEAETNSETKTTFIKANCENEVSQDVLVLLKEKVTEIRNEFIQQ